MGEKEV
jgi:hypothetical protein